MPYIWERLNYFECCMANRKLQELTRMNKRTFFCNQYEYKFGAWDNDRYVVVYRKKENEKRFSQYTDVDIGFCHSASEVIKTVIEKAHINPNEIRKYSWETRCMSLQELQLYLTSL